jgi:hypothetical protein
MAAAIIKKKIEVESPHLCAPSLLLHCLAAEQCLLNFSSCPQLLHVLQQICCLPPCCMLHAAAAAAAAAARRL